VARYAARVVKGTNPADPSAPSIVRKAVRFGAGVRGAQSLLLGARAVALMKGNAHVSFADVTSLALPALRHRLLRSFAGEADGVSADALVRAVLDAVPARPEGVEAVLRERRR
jgi:MoxR-like ATPase